MTSNSPTAESRKAAKRPPSDTSPKYVVDEPVAFGALQEIAPGVHWLRMPLPFAGLDHINLWLLDDDNNTFTLVDTGFGTDETKALWDKLFASPQLAGRKASRLVCTHYHNDHAGLAGWLTERFKVPLFMSNGEFYASHSVYAEVASHEPGHLHDIYLRNGLDKGTLAKMLEMRNSYRTNVRRFPSQFRRLLDEDQIRIGGRNWEIIAGYGHSPEHSALHCAELGVLIAGDMVLPRITTNISVQATEPDGNPMGLWFRSLARNAKLPADTLVLPSHGLPFRGLRPRLAFIKAHHEARLKDLLEACKTPKTAADILPVLFNRQMDVHQTGIAMGEALAHLHYLWYDGRMKRTTDANGIVHFQTV